jgi:hypothetical protein
VAGEFLGALQEVPTVKLKNMPGEDLRRPLADPLRAISFHNQVLGFLHLKTLLHPRIETLRKFLWRLPRPPLQAVDVEVFIACH